MSPNTRNATPTRMTSVVFAALLSIPLASCADDLGSVDADDSVDRELPSGPQAVGAPANFTLPGAALAVRDYSALLNSPATATIDTVRTRKMPAELQVVAVQAQLGQPSHVWANATTDIAEPEAAALDYLERFRSAYLLSAETVDTAVINQVHDTGRGGVIVQLSQSVAGVPVHSTRMSIIMDRDNKLLAMTGSLHPAALPLARLRSLEQAPSDALELAVGDAAIGDVSVISSRVRPVLYPHPKWLEHSHLVEFEIAPAGSTVSRAYAYVVADDGRILERLNRTVSDSFDYRVYAEPVAPFRPRDNPQSEFSPHPTENQNDGPVGFENSAVIAMEGFNTNPAGAADPWLPANATTTQGNNVHAYADITGNDGLDNGDIEITATGAQTFDYNYNVAQTPNTNTDQVRAVGTNLFYTINWLHNYFYDSGFNEAAFVAQADNFGRGGEDGDVLLAEAQDQSGTNNANMSTPTDGTSPRMQMFIWNRAPGVNRDSSLDNTIVAHEWGHYFHHRLSICGGTIQCRGMSEGWGDFVALHMMVRDGDDLSGTYPIAGYSIGDSYFGIRRSPLSNQMTKNALTFRHIGNDNALPGAAPIRANGLPNAQQHNHGEVWSTMLTEAYFALIADPRHTFLEAQRRMADYMVGGLLATPPDATVTETRDAILAFAAASDPEDMLVLANAFARRGAGTAAQGPDRTSPDNTGIVESYDLGGQVAIADLALELANDCDADTNFDAGETALLNVTVTNAGPVSLADSTVTISTTQAGISFPEGATQTIAMIDGFTPISVPFEVALADDAALGIDSVVFTVEIENAGSLVTTAERTLASPLNFDDVPESSANDDVESALEVWAPVTDVATFNWARTANSPDNHLWHGDDAGVRTDQRLESPVLMVGADPFVISFDHRYSFEFDGTAWDGGVIELSSDGGSTWVDIGAPAGYSQVITDESENPLGGRNGLAGDSPGYPSMAPATINLGTTYSGQAVQVRFRIGTDLAVGGPGWDVDNLVFAGITNTPFATVGDDVGECNPEPEPEPEPEPGDDDDGGGCGCQSSGSGTSGLLLILIGLAFVGRRRRS